jgi:hypothetical protein
MKVFQGVLNNPRILPWASVFCILESIWSWTSIARGTHYGENVSALPFFVFLLFVAVSIARRSSFWADRVVFWTIAGICVLASVRTFALTPESRFIINTLHALMWTTAGFVSLMVLIRGSRTPGAT